MNKVLGLYKLSQKSMTTACDILMICVNTIPYIEMLFWRMALKSNSQQIAHFLFLYKDVHHNVFTISFSQMILSLLKSFRLTNLKKYKHNSGMQEWLEK